MALALIAAVLTSIAVNPPQADAAEPAADHLLVSEFVTTPTAGEFIEIHNPTIATVSLTDVYLTDATFAGDSTFYYQLVTGGGGGGGFGDFFARFPAGSSIAAGEYQTISLSGSDSFTATYGGAPTYELFEDGGAADGIPDMLEATAGSINDQGGLSSGEVVVLLSWDGASDLVTDLDYVLFGDKAEAVDKTGVAIDGPDADTTTSTYAADTSTALQDAVAADQVHTAGKSWQRADLTEGTETKSGGNGITGHDETSENVSTTWGEDLPTPNLATNIPPPPPGGGGLDPVPPLGLCGDAFTAIHDLQGSADEGPFEDGTGIVTEGVVTAIFDALSGYYLQDAVGDGDATTSEGIFVTADTAGVIAGNTLRVAGRVSEVFGNTQIGSVEATADCGVGAVIAPTTLDLPNADREPFEGMLVTFPDRLYVTDTFNLTSFGEVWVAEGGVIEQPTNAFGVATTDLVPFADANMARAILMDDGSLSSAASPPPYLPPGGTIRLGDSVDGLTGTLHFAFGNFRVMPTAAVTIDVRNVRPSARPAVGTDLIVASFNVLNFWTTLGERGASTTEQFDIQLSKLVTAITGLDADIIGLQEMENDPTHTPITTLVAALNAAEGASVWAWVGENDTYNVYPIRNEIIYRIATVTPVGGPMTIADPAFDDERSPGGDQLGRPPVAQTFSAGEEVFTVMVNHFKSKSCTAASGADDDQGDGQACYNARRVLQAERVLQFVGEIQAMSGDPDVLVLGDINAYGEEDPVLELETELVNVLDMYVADQYTFNFFAASSAPWIGRGALDQALATPGMALKTTGAAIWHINADEPTSLGWSGTDLTLVAPAEFRSSDHDPLLIGIELPTAFSDIGDSVFKNDILFMSAAGITLGCNPPANDNYCPDDPLTRGQLAAMFVRALHLPATGTDFFTDDETSVFEDNINRLAAAGITLGCNPPANDNYCPNDNVTRGQVAAMFARALSLPATGTDFFTDDELSIFEADINRLAAAGITRGCNPPANDNYCPQDLVTRGQIAAFFNRAVG